MTIHICRPAVSHARRVLRCPTCQQRRRVVVAVPHSPWYGPIATCCACGESWGEEGIAPRPFRPRWREEEARRARKEWREGVSWTEATSRVEAP